MSAPPLAPEPASPWKICRQTAATGLGVSVTCVSANASKPPLHSERTANQDPGQIPSVDLAHSLTDFCNKISTKRTRHLGCA
jgi:hypothetical protein